MLMLPVANNSHQPRKVHRGKPGAFHHRQHLRKAKAQEYTVVDSAGGRSDVGTRSFKSPEHPRLGGSQGSWSLPTNAVSIPLAAAAAGHKGQSQGISSGLDISSLSSGALTEWCAEKVTGFSKVKKSLTSSF